MVLLLQGHRTSGLHGLPAWLPPGSSTLGYSPWPPSDCAASSRHPLPTPAVRPPGGGDGGAPGANPQGLGTKPATTVGLLRANTGTWARSRNTRRPADPHFAAHRRPRRRSRHHAAARHLPPGAGFPGQPGARRQRPAAADGGRHAEPRPARPRPARRGRAGHRAPAARALALRPGHRHRPRRPGRQGRRARDRRRRLRHQAFRPARAAGAHPRRAAPAGPGRGAAGRCRRRGNGRGGCAGTERTPALRPVAARHRRPAPARHRRQGGAAHHGRVRAARRLRAPPGARAVARLPAREHARPRSRALRPHDRRAGGAPAQEARGRPRTARDHQVGARCRLRLHLAGRHDVTAHLDESTVFRALFAAYPDALLLVDGEGGIALANPAAAALLGYSTAELAGMNVDALVPDAVRPRHAAYRATYQAQPRARPMGTDMSLVARRRDGSEVMVEIALSPLQQHGLPYVVAAIRGIGEYPRVREAIKRARYAECVAQVGRFAVDARDPQQLMRRATAAAVEALEVEQAVLYLLEPDGQRFRVAAGTGLPTGEPEGTLVPNRPDTPPGYVLAQGAPVTVADYLGETRFQVPPSFRAAGLVSALGVPLSDRGRVVGAISVRSRQARRFGEDEARFLESLAHLLATSVQRAQSDEALRHAQRLESVGQLTGGIAHDFNNLLTVIQGNLQVLESLPALAGDADAEPLVTAAARATRRGAELTGKLLAFSRRQLLQPARVDTGALVHSLADMLRRTLDQRIRIEVSTGAPCPPCLADPVQLESALLNVAINARDAMPDGGTLTIAARACESLPAPLAEQLAADAAAARFVEIAVADTGCGMSDAVKERAFEPFFTTKQTGRGTGLGLSTVYGFARQSNGGITLESAPGAGTTIRLFMPRWELPDEADAHEPDAAVGVPAGLRVLLVEDEPEVLRIVMTFLLGWGCDVTACASAEQALAALLESVEGNVGNVGNEGGGAFDLLVTDVVLGPGMRGTELAQHARRHRPGMPVLLMSGYASDLRGGEGGLTLASLASLTSLASAGTTEGPAPELLRKPFSREELAAAIGALMGPLTAGSRRPDAGSPG
ncbi:MAG: GAF domain-containing protein [Burkholderiales bacterium]|nr:GAF domain-containing protein [Burkholderiales bacterium]